MADVWTGRAERIQLAGQREFGETTIYTPVNGRPISIKGAFSAAHVDVQMINGVSIESVSPVLSVHLADLPGCEAERSAGVLVRGCFYTVAEVRKDGEGDADLYLEEF